MRIVWAVWSLADWDMSSGRNWQACHSKTTASLADWDMSSGRNTVFKGFHKVLSLADWDMSSGRNIRVLTFVGFTSLADWDMSSGRNPFAKRLATIVACAPTPPSHFANGRAKARLLIKKIPNELNRTTIHGWMVIRFD
jgi:hypothetical protein